MRVNQIESGDYVKIEGRVFKVLETTHSHLGRGGANLELKLQDVLKGNVIRRNFKPDEEIEYVEIEKKEIYFAYFKGNSCFFKDQQGKFLEIDCNLIEEKVKFLKKDLKVTGIFLDEELLTIELPIKVVYEVKESPPGIRGNTAQGGSKVVICENGLEVSVPLFIEVGDKIIVNTQTGEYVSKI